MPPPANLSQIFQAENKNLTFPFIKRPILSGLMAMIDLLQEIYTEEIQLHGQDNLLQDNLFQNSRDWDSLNPDGKQPFPGPYLWLCKHEVSMDVINLVPLWMDLHPSLRFDFQTAMRNFKEEERVLKMLDALVLKHFTYHVSRTSRGEGASLNEVEKLRRENEQQFQKVREGYRKGIHAVLFPEGTTQTDGTVFPIKSGCYNLAKIESTNGNIENGSIEVITTVPVGLTYDHLSGKANPLFPSIPRKQVFINIGKLFHYKPLPHSEPETADAYVKADIKNHARRVRESLIQLNTFTVAQLAGEYVFSKALAGRKVISSAELEDILTERVELLGKLPQTVFDEKLQDEEGRRYRLEQFWNGLERKEYLTENRSGHAKLSAEKILSLPSLKHYKRDNPLRYCVNRIMQLGYYRDDVKLVFEKTATEKLKRNLFSPFFIEPNFIE